MLVLRSILPTLVRRGSFLILKTGPSISFSIERSLLISSALSTIVLNFRQVKRRPLYPTRCCLKKMGPLDVDLMIILTTANKEESNTSEVAETTRSINRLPHITGAAARFFNVERRFAEWWSIIQMLRSFTARSFGKPESTTSCPVAAYQT